MFQEGKAQQSSSRSYHVDELLDLLILWRSLRAMHFLGLCIHTSFIDLTKLVSYIHAFLDMHISKTLGLRKCFVEHTLIGGSRKPIGTFTVAN